MARETTKWPSTRWPITKIMSSDGCNGNRVPWRWGRGTISANLDVIWGMSVNNLGRPAAGLRRFNSTARLRILTGLLLLLAVISTPLARLRAGDASILERIVVVTDSGEHVLEVEIADADATRARGLMFRRSLAPNRGMLFLYEAEQMITMWMRNTYISLDMVFIRADGRVNSTVLGAEPFSEEIIASGGPTMAVLEIAAGGAVRLGLKTGDLIHHRHFGTAP